MSNTNGGLQLLPETRRRIDVYIPGQNRWLLIASVFVGLVLLTGGGLYLYRQSIVKEIATIDGQLQQIENQRKPADEDKLLKLKEAITAAKPILANHVVWSTAFDRIQHLILPQVQFDNLSVKLNKGEYSFRAFASNFVTVARQIAAFNGDDAIINTDIGKMSAQTDGRVQFNAKLNLDLNKINNPIKPKP